VTELFDSQFYLLALIAARLAGMIFTAPFFASKMIPVRLRLAVCVVIAFAAIPMVQSNFDVKIENATDFGGCFLAELLTGALFGLAVHIVFKAMLVAGEAIAKPMGIGDHAGNNPGETVSTTGRLFDLLALVVFILIGGPNFLISAVFDSLIVRPIGTAVIDLEHVRSLLSVIPASFSLALRIAAPILICQIIATISVGMVSRTLPQLSTLQIGMPIGVMVTICIALFSLSGATLLYADQIEISIRNLLQDLSPSP
jgi:flagellar biosynthetic protein FliR